MRNDGASLRISLVLTLIAGLAVTGTALAGATHGPGFTAHGSARQVYATGLAAGAKAELVDSFGHVVKTKAADSLGGLLFRHVQPGSGYHVRVVSNGKQSGAITVRTNASKPWDPKVYDQSIPDHGYGYLETRDGTTLAYKVWQPNNPPGEGLPDINLPPGLPKYSPPYPTLIEYSGYGYADPSGPESGIAVLANLMGFAVVDVNMRGMGCSGGAFDFFEPLQSLDGYDVIETIARQPWVLHHKVGMMGISYGGISQLFTAQTHPPSLAAISPLSVIDATATLTRGSRFRGRRSVSTRPCRPVRTPVSRGRGSRSRPVTRPARPTRPCTVRLPTSIRRSWRTRTIGRGSPTRSTP